ncbi:PPE family protein [Mycobacterium sp. M1]|uniref:PPE family protein n=1 Tax=Mycolicibacter acidiphilus TaxID=2835306 RepID=A0ABS5RGD3_9MYCO|nr:PPE family protein [Mycolicibacter acidiphilus]MBS9533341.1 PPE family protein [Mycolicibacter acidiphilus]
MDCAVLPPEVTSGRLYTGPGAAPMLAAATAWKSLAAELHSAATAYAAVIAELTTSWRGPSATAMAAAATPYLQWMSATGAQAADLAARSDAAAAAYADAFAAIVPPPVIAANRADVATLTATNLLGQNTPAIAAAEAAYLQMWLRNTATMQGYAATSAAATRAEPFAAPPQVTDLDGLLGGLVGSSSASGLYEQAFTATVSLSKLSTFANAGMSAPNLGMVQFKNFFKPAVTTVDLPKSTLGAALRSAPPAAAVGPAPPVFAGAANADLVGRLSVPPTWAATAPAIRLAATALPNPLPALPAGLPSGAVPAAALGGLAGGALGGAGPRVLNATTVRGGSRAGRSPVQLDRVIATLQRQPAAVRHWNVDEAGFDDLITELSKKPGIHTVHLSAETPK